MAAPNIVNVTLINANSNTQILTSNNEIGLLSNPASSGKVYKVNTILVANKDGANAIDVTCNLWSQAALGGSSFPIAFTISVPADATLILTDKSTSFYLEENRSIGIKSGSANGLSVLCSWEEIS
jgi:hypothetical protein